MVVYDHLLLRSCAHCLFSSVVFPPSSAWPISRKRPSRSGWWHSYHTRPVHQAQTHTSNATSRHTIRYSDQLVGFLLHHHGLYAGRSSDTCQEITDVLPPDTASKSQAQASSFQSSTCGHGSAEEFGRRVTRSKAERHQTTGFSGPAPKENETGGKTGTGLKESVADGERRGADGLAITKAMEDAGMTAQKWKKSKSGGSKP